LCHRTAIFQERRSCKETGQEANCQRKADAANAADTAPAPTTIKTYTIATKAIVKPTVIGNTWDQCYKTFYVRIL
jgi:hypothetical protein